MQPQALTVALHEERHLSFTFCPQSVSLCSPGMIGNPEPYSAEAHLRPKDQTHGHSCTVRAYKRVYSDSKIYKGAGQQLVIYTLPPP